MRKIVIIFLSMFWVLKSTQPLLGLFFWIPTTYVFHWDFNNDLLSGGMRSSSTLDIYILVNYKKEQLFFSFLSTVRIQISSYVFCKDYHQIWNVNYHAREPLYSNSAVIAWCSQSTGAQNILFWFTVIHSMSQFFTTFHFHDVFFHLELLLGYCSPFWPNKSL